MDFCNCVLITIFLFCTLPHKLLARKLNIYGRMTCFLEYQKSDKVHVELLEKGDLRDRTIINALTDINGYYNFTASISSKSDDKSYRIGVIHDCANTIAQDNCLRHFKIDIPTHLSQQDTIYFGALTLVPPSIEGEERFCNKNEL